MNAHQEPIDEELFSRLVVHSLFHQNAVDEEVSYQERKMRRGVSPIAFLSCGGDLFHQTLTNSRNYSLGGCGSSV